MGLIGSGTDSEPLGLYGRDTIKKIKQAGATFGYADLLAAYQTQLEGKAPAPTAAIMAPRTLVGLAGLTDTTGQPLAAPPPLSGVRQMATNGVPVHLSTGNANSVAFVGNFSAMQFVMRENLNIGVLREAYARTGESKPRRHGLSAMRCPVLSHTLDCLRLPSTKAHCFLQHTKRQRHQLRIAILGREQPEDRPNHVKGIGANVALVREVLYVDAERLGPFVNELDCIDSGNAKVLFHSAIARQLQRPSKDRPP